MIQKSWAFSKKWFHKVVDFLESFRTGVFGFLTNLSPDHIHQIGISIFGVVAFNIIKNEFGQIRENFSPFVYFPAPEQLFFGSIFRFQKIIKAFEWKNQLWERAKKILICSHLILDCILLLKRLSFWNCQHFLIFLILNINHACFNKSNQLKSPS